MRRFSICLVLGLLLGSCAYASGPGDVPPSSPTGPSRVELVEAGLRGVLPRTVDGPLFIRTELCTTSFTADGEETCGRPLSESEIGDLAARLADLSRDLRFVASYEDIPDGQAPIDKPGVEFAWVSEPELQADGTYQLEAGETCGGLCGHGGSYVLEEGPNGWRSTGPVPGTGQWIS